MGDNHGVCLSYRHRASIFVNLIIWFLAKDASRIGSKNYHIIARNGDQLGVSSYWASRCQILFYLLKFCCLLLPDGRNLQILIGFVWHYKQHNIFNYPLLHTLNMLWPLCVAPFYFVFKSHYCDHIQALSALSVAYPANREHFVALFNRVKGEGWRIFGVSYRLESCWCWPLYV